MFSNARAQFRFLVLLLVGLGVWSMTPQWDESGTEQSLILLAMSDAHAASGKVDPEDAALALFQEAKTFFENGNFKGALQRLQQAWELYKQPVIALQLAEVHEKLGQPEEALEALQGLEKLKIRDGELRLKVEVRKKALVNFLIQPLSVSVISDVSTSQVRVDDSDIRYPPFDVQLPRGKHTLKAEAIGYRSFEQVIDVRGSVPMQVRFSLQPLTGTVAIRSGQATLEGLQIIVDGVPWVIQPGARASKMTRPRTAKVGTHQVVCWHEGRTKDIQSFSIREGEDVVVKCRSGLVQRGEVNRAWGSVALGAAIGSAVAGGYLLYAWNQDMGKAERQNLNIETNKHIFGGSLLLLAAGSGVASYYFFGRTDGDEAAKPKTAQQSGDGAWMVTLLPGQDSLGVGASLRF